MDEKELFENTVNEQSGTEPSDESTEAETAAKVVEEIPAEIKAETEGEEKDGILAEPVQNEGTQDESEDGGEETENGDGENAESEKKQIWPFIAGFLIGFLAVLAVYLIFFNGSAKKDFFKASAEIIDRHFNFTDDTKAIYEGIKTFDTPTEAEISVSGDSEKKISLDYDHSRLYGMLEENGTVEFYADADNTVLSNGETSYGYSHASGSAFVSKYDSDKIALYKDVFENIPKERKELLDALKKTVSDSLADEYFEKCKGAFDGSQYDAVRLYLGGAQSATAIRKFLEETAMSSNGYYQSTVCSVLVKGFSITAGASDEATLSNAIDEIAKKNITLEAFIFFEKNEPTAFSLKITVDETVIESAYKYKSRGSAADVEFSVKINDNDILKLSGSREIAKDGYVSKGTVDFTGISNDGNGTVSALSGEYEIGSKDGIILFGLNLKSENGNDVISLTYSNNENFSLGYSEMSQGYGVSYLLTADKEKEKGKFNLKNGKLSVNEIASDTLLEYYGLSSTDLGSQNYDFNFSLGYDKSKADISLEIKSENALNLTFEGKVENKDNFILKLFEKNILFADGYDLNGKMTLDGKNYNISAACKKGSAKDSKVLTADKSLNGEQSVFDQTAFTEFARAFSKFKDGAFFNAFWEKVIVDSANEMSAGAVDTTDYNSVEFDYDIFEKVKIGMTGEEVEKLFGAKAVRSFDSEGQVTYYDYYSPDFSKAEYKGKNFSCALVDGKTVYKYYLDYNLAFTDNKVPESAVSKIKKGMTPDEVRVLIGNMTPIVHSLTDDGSENSETVYYGSDGQANIGLMLNFKDGKLVDIETAEK